MTPRQQLRSRYPAILAHASLSYGDGWAGIMEALCERLQFHGAQDLVVQRNAGLLYLNAKMDLLALHGVMPPLQQRRELYARAREAAASARLPSAAAHSDSNTGRAARAASAAAWAERTAASAFSRSASVRSAFSRLP